MKKLKKKRLKSFKRLKNDLDKIFSLFIRSRDGGVCFTCGKRGEIKEMQNGHFFSRLFTSTRWDERNCHTQCVACNIFRKGNMAVYALKMNQTYGPEIIEYLYNQSRELTKLNRGDMEIRIDYYKDAVEKFGAVSR